jgi:outer membrane protein TolC
MKRNIIILLLGLVPWSIIAQSFTLESCKQLALENNRKIKDAQLKTYESQEVKKNAVTKYFPKVMGGAIVMKSNDYLLKEKIPAANLPVYDGNPANLQTATQFAYFPGMDLNLFDYANIGYVAAIQPVYMGGRVRYGNSLATKGVEIKQHQLELTKQEVLVTIEEQYWTIVSLKERMKTIDSYYDLLENLLGDIKVSYEAGLAQKTDLLKIELEINELKGKKLQLLNGQEIMTRMICQNMGVEYNELADIVYKELTIDNVTHSEQNSDLAYLKRQEYQILTKAIEAEKLQTKIARGETLPQLTVGLQGLYLDMMETQSTNYLGFATLNIPISDWWGGTHKVKEHKYKIEIAENDLAEKSELIRLQITNADKELVESTEQILIATSSLSHASENFKITKDNYKAGLLNTSELLEAQALFQDAENNLTDALCTNKIKQALCKKSRGIVNL